MSIEKGISGERDHPRLDSSFFMSELKGLSFPVKEKVNSFPRRPAYLASIGSNGATNFNFRDSNNGTSTSGASIIVHSFIGAPIYGFRPDNASRFCKRKLNKRFGLEADG